jgi:hypothetical protein
VIHSPEEQAPIRLIDASVPFRVLERAGDAIVHAWADSAGGRALAAWMALPLERRVRLVAMVVGVAISTHLALTRFSAPEPTWWARAAWIVILTAVAAAGIGSRAVAAAWTDWMERRTPREDA